MKKSYGILILIIFLIIPVASAQMADKANIGTIKQDYLGLQPAVKPFSLIDFSRLKWTHSYSLSFFSGGGTSGSIGLYTGNIFYEFSPKLSLDLKLGIAHDPGSLFGKDAGTSATFLPGLHLDYHPSPSFSISINFSLCDFKS